MRATVLDVFVKMHCADQIEKVREAEHVRALWPTPGDRKRSAA